jgi:hypothetical protein
VRSVPPHLSLPAVEQRAPVQDWWRPVPAEAEKTAEALLQLALVAGLKG